MMSKSEIIGVFSTHSFTFSVSSDGQIGRFHTSKFREAGCTLSGPIDVLQDRAFRLIDPPRGNVCCASLCGDHLLGTGTGDGVIVLWDLTGGTAIGAINVQLHLVQESSRTSPLTVECIAWLENRIEEQTKRSFRNTATLVTSHSSGQICFWNVVTGSCLGQFSVRSQNSGNVAGVGVIAIDRMCNHLYSGDVLGRVCIFDIGEYCCDGPSRSGPSLLRSWEAHVDGVSAIAIDEEKVQLVSSSSDCTIRVWDLVSGEPIRDLLMSHRFPSANPFSDRRSGARLSTNTPFRQKHALARAAQLYIERIVEFSHLRKKQTRTTTEYREGSRRQRGTLEKIEEEADEDESSPKLPRTQPVEPLKHRNVSRCDLTASAGQLNENAIDFNVTSGLDRSPILGKMYLQKSLLRQSQKQSQRLRSFRPTTEMTKVSGMS